VKITQHRYFIQFAKYMVGGGVYFWGGLLVFFTCYNLLHWRWLYAKMLADILGWTANYVIQRYWAFADSKLKGQDRRVVRRYVLVNAVDLGIDYCIVAYAVHAGWTPYVGFFITASFTTVWDYLWYGFWVFKTA
jgi:putative flippase GtrA